MRKAMFLILCLSFLAVLIGCETIPGIPESSSTAWGEKTTATPAETSAATPKATLTPVATVLSQPTPSPTMLPSISPSPSSTEGPEMYSSYAHMVSYDPALGTADFDYFDLLQGDDAVDWLVNSKGYSQADAEAEVDGFADSEFIEKNTNPQLRTINLADIPITLMFDPDTGDMLDVNHPLTGSLEDLYKLYDLDHKLVLNTFFYWIEVKDGKVVSVQQVFWP